MNDESDWLASANEAVGAGYMPGNQWEQMLRSHLLRLFPKLVAELRSSGAFEPYLQCQTWHAMEMLDRMEDEGNEPIAAREFVLDQLLPTPPEEIDRPEAWEVEAGAYDMADAAQKMLSTLAETVANN